MESLENKSASGLGDFGGPRGVSAVPAGLA